MHHHHCSNYLAALVSEEDENTFVCLSVCAEVTDVDRNVESVVEVTREEEEEEEEEAIARTQREQTHKYIDGGCRNNPFMNKESDPADVVADDDGNEYDDFELTLGKLLSEDEQYLMMEAG